MTGLLFREFAFTLAAAVIISRVISLMLSPMLCAKLLAHEKPESEFERRSNAYFLGHATPSTNTFNYRPAVFKRIRII
nr:efflux RND transporter permease subunit [Rickettsiella massiliensis]